MAYVSISVEGGMFPSDLLDRMAAGADGLDGQRAEDFGLPRGARLTEEMQAAFAEMRQLRDMFHRRQSRATENLTTLTRRRWIEPLLDALGYHELQVQRSNLAAGQKTFAISHLAGDDEHAPPVNIIAYDQDLDAGQGRRGRAPHSQVQEYLNNGEALWGLVTNGQKLRLLRDSATFSRPTYVEFDLDRMAEENLYSEFVLLYRLVHRTRLPVSSSDAHECYLEKYYRQGVEQGGRVKEKLRDGVEEALKTFGTALLAHPASDQLREAIRSGRLDELGYYRQLLRLIYRLLFLLVAEERRQLFDETTGARDLQQIYVDNYSITALRNRVDRLGGDRRGGGRHSDLWQGLLTTFELFRHDDSARKLGLHALDGELFGPHGCRELETATCDNDSLVAAIKALSWFEDTEGRGRNRRGVMRRVNYGGLNVEELGSIYESLLDFAPAVSLEPLRFRLVPGSERKTTGSYYTPAELVRELVNSALVPVIEDRLDGAVTPEAREHALLEIKVLDPAAGSGHFLLAAARRIAHELAKVRTGTEEPPPRAFGEALRDVIRNCVYAVDKNPLAVDLCKVALWMESQQPGLPLSFLDHRVRLGDSLVGVFDLKVLQDGIPDGAYKDVTGDDKAIAKAVRERNKKERSGQLSLGMQLDPDPLTGFASEIGGFADIEERSAEDHEVKAKLFEELRHGPTWYRYKVACDLWTAAFFTPLKKETFEFVPTTEEVRKQLSTSSKAAPFIVGQAAELQQRLSFFHWPLEFPDVFTRGGFDCVLGNPPYVASTVLKNDNPKFRQYAECQFTSARGNWDLYVAFVELALKLVRDGGRNALLTPARILASDYCAELHQLLLGRRIIRCIDFSDLSLFEDAAISVAVVTVCNLPYDPDFPTEFVRMGRGFVPTVVRQVAAEKLRRLPAGYLCFPITANRPELIDLVELCPQLASLASLSDGATTAEAYLIRELVRDGADYEADGDCLRLVNTGTIDPFKLLWGIAPISYLGFKGLYPTVRTTDLAAIAPRRVTQSLVDKVVVGGVGRRIEAATAPAGFLCGKSTVAVVPNGGVCAYALTALLNSSIATSLYVGLFGLRSVRGDWMNLGPRQLGQLPVPASDWLRPSTYSPIGENALADPHVPGALSWLGRQITAIATAPQDHRRNDLLLQLVETAAAMAYGLREDRR